MSHDFGNGVSRTLSALMRQFDGVVWQQDKPPLDSELNLMSQIEWDRMQRLVRAVMPSGFFLDPTRAYDDFEFNPQWANLLKLGTPRTPTGVHEGPEQTPVVWANVNGWIIPVAGTDVVEGEEVTNWIKLYPAPESDGRVDFVFLEAWQTLVRPNPSTINKPSSSSVWKYGNTKFGGTNISDDLEDPEAGFETTARVQTQYRIRVFGQGVGLGAGLALDVYPDGLDDPNVLGQGANSTPVAGLQWSNMREELGDPSLWRAGDGDANSDLGTVDGYSYAIPLCAIFRRNSNVYVAVNSSGNPNQNGAFERTPGSKLLVNPLEGSKALLQASLTDPLPYDSEGVAISITNLNGSGLEDSGLVLASTFLRVGEEVFGISAVDVAGGTITLAVGGRGRWGTAAVGHPAGASIQFFNSRPDGKYADQVDRNDILDLRRGINPGDWDFQRLLAHNVAALAKGELRTAWKKSGAGDSEGVSVHEVDYLHADGSVVNPNHTEVLDGPDGIRTVWSDAAVIQSDVTLLLDDDATLTDGGVGLTTNDQFDTNVRWDVSPDFKPTGFLNVGATPNAGFDKAWTNGSCIHIYIGGEDGTQGARKTFRDGSERAVRFVTPTEMWKTGYPVVDSEGGNQHPVSLRFLGARAHAAPPTELSVAEKVAHPGPMYPWRNHGFETPFMALGGILDANAKATLDVDTALVNAAAAAQEIDLGFNFDTDGVFHSKDSHGVWDGDTSAAVGEAGYLSRPMLRGSRTLREMLTRGGKDTTGSSSEVYIVLYGDQDSTQNNGLFRVIGAGTVGYTNNNATNATSVVVQPVSADWDAGTRFVATGNLVTAEMRSPHHNSDDVSDYAGRTADLVVVLTDLKGERSGDGDYPWLDGNLVQGAYDNSFDGEVEAGKVGVTSKAVLSLSLLYHPGRGGAARVPDDITRFALRGPTTQSVGTYLQQNGADIDTTFSSVSGVPTDETFFEQEHIQTWNRIPGYGWHAPVAPSYGGTTVGFTEIDRESQLFIDKGSKTLVFRPFRDRQLTLEALSFLELDTTSLIGDYQYPNADQKDGLSLWTAASTPAANLGKQMGFDVPREYMPRFGRQDIPNYQDIDAGQGTFLSGINHLFTDKADATNPVFNIIGGAQDNVTSGNEVTLFHFITGTPTCYGKGDTVGGAFLGLPNVEARKTTDIDPNASTFAQEIVDYLAQVNSSEFGRGLRGIQLPPYHGPARIMGVYEKDDFLGKGGRTFKANRYQIEDDPATNLLRGDAEKMSLFIMQNGAKDRTEADGDHTYILPEHTLDLTRIPTWATNDDFGDFEYVVVCTVFGFSRGFISENNLVLARKHNGQGVLRTDGMTEDNGDGDKPIHLEGVPMCIPCPAGSNDQFYIAHNRTVYQGDPFMSRHGENRTTSDYQFRYGQISTAGQNSLRTAIQQYDANGNFVPETINERAFQVLASLDFYTTLGTGKIGGELFPGTVLDVGHTENSPAAASRMPESASQPDWRVVARAFSEGQKENSSRARANYALEAPQYINAGIIDGVDLGGANEHWSMNFKLLDGEIVKLYGTLSANEAALQARPDVNAEDTFLIDETSGIVRGTVTANQAITAFTPENPFESFDFAAAGALPGDTVQVTPTDPAQWRSAAAEVVLSGFCTTKDVVRVQAVMTPSPGAFNPQDVGDGHMVRQFSLTFPSPIPGETAGAATTTVSWPGVGGALDEMVLATVDEPLTLGAHVKAEITGPDTIQVYFHNPSNVGYVLGAPITVTLAVLQDTDQSAWTLDPSLGNPSLSVSFSRNSISQEGTAENLALAILGHSKLQRSVRAYSLDKRVEIESVPTGAEGNGIYIWTDHEDATYSENSVGRFNSLFSNAGPVSTGGVLPPCVATYLMGGVDKPVNAGIGTSQLKLTGMTERLPLGALLQDSDFLSENPLGGNASAMRSSPANIQPIQSLLPLTGNGDEYTRFLGAPGELLGMSDGHTAIDGFAAYTTATPTGAKRFRIYRGGGSAFVLHGDVPGGPIDWVSDSLPFSSNPVLKGGVLVCRAMLVRNFYEEAFSGSPYKVSDGDEIQMVILTQGILGNGNTTEEGINLDGIISPTGYGEGYAAADRYRINGRPMFRGYSRRVPDPSEVALAVYDENARGGEGGQPGGCS
jgi:hypothetical protein